MVKILVAPDKFKGSLSAQEVCIAIKKGLTTAQKNIEVTSIPLADGGEGTFEILSGYYHASAINVEVHDPLFQKISTTYGISEDGTTAFVEMAMASGLQLVEKQKQNPLYTTSLGTGELIADALNRGVKKIVLGIGGSATNDAGVGMARALGYEFYDRAGNRLEPIGKNLIQIHLIDSSTVHKKIKSTEFIVLSDVNNNLFGKNGAAYVYGPQKGADENTVRMLDDGLQNFSRVVKLEFKKDADFPGAGAAGGLGSGAKIFLNATIISGISFIMKLVDLERKIQASDVVITGEGKVDEQTLKGKVVGEVSRLSAANKKPLIIVCGKCELTSQQRESLHSTTIISLVDNLTSEENAIKNASGLIEEKISGLSIPKN